MIPMKQEATSTTALGSKSNNNNSKPSSRRASSTSSWSRLKDPRIVCVSRAFGGKDRHSKVCTVRGIRDRRVRLSVPTAIQLYDLQDRLGLNQPSKVVDWLLNAARHGIDELPPLQIPEGCFARMISSLGRETPKIDPDDGDWRNPKSNHLPEGLFLSREKPCFQIPGVNNSSISMENACFQVPGLENSVAGEKACYQNPGLEKYSAPGERACFHDPGMSNFDPSNETLSQIIIPESPTITGQPDRDLQYNLGNLLQLPSSIFPSGLSISHHQPNCYIPCEMRGENSGFVPNKLSNFSAYVATNSSSLPSLVHYREIDPSAVRTAAPFSAAEHFLDVKKNVVMSSKIG